MLEQVGRALRRVVIEFVEQHQVGAHPLQHRGDLARLVVAALEPPHQATVLVAVQRGVVGGDAQRRGLAHDRLQLFEGIPVQRARRVALHVDAQASGSARTAIAQAASRRFRAFHVLCPRQRRFELQALPIMAVESFQRLETSLVVHLHVSCDPVAEVQVFATFAPRPFDLFQDRERAEPARALVRVVEGVHRRQCKFHDIGDRHGQQAVRCLFAELDEAAFVPAPDQELVELRAAMLVHAAAAMARAEIALVQGQLLIAAFGRQHAHIDVGVAGEAATLAAVGTEFGHGHAHRDAGTAPLAMRPVDDVAAATEAPRQRLRIQLRQARIARVQHQVARNPRRPVTAGVIAAVEHPQFLVVQGRLVAGFFGSCAHAGRIARHGRADCDWPATQG